MLQLTYPTPGRGAWSSIGGTLSSDGTKPGTYYRSPAGTMKMPGLAGYTAVQQDGSIDINSYAVYMAVKGIQREVGVTEDGLFGPATGAAVSSWQIRHGLESDGVFGPTTARTMFRAVALTIARNASPNLAVTELVFGHVGFESGWDPGAVGYVEPRDLGLGQINGPAHPELTPSFRLSPRPALAYVANFVLNNLESMLWIARDAIAAYNLGVGGARAWVSAGRPAEFKGVNVAGYINGVLANIN